MKITLLATIALVIAPLSGAAVTTTGQSPLSIAEPAHAQNEPPLVDAGLDQYVDVGNIVLLDGGGSRDPDGRIVEYEWEIITPNGTSTKPRCRTCLRTQFRPTRAGVYGVTLSVTDDDGATRSDTLYVTVRDGTHGQGEGPTVSLSGPTSVQRGEERRFDAEFDRGSSPLSTVVWSLDGNKLTDETITPSQSTAMLDHAFSSTGEHTLTVTVTDEAGRRATTSLDVRVADGNGTGIDRAYSPSVRLEMEGDDRLVEPGQAVTLLADARDPDGEIVSYEWFREGSKLSSGGPNHSSAVRRNPGATVDYTVVVTDDDGRTARDSLTLEVVSDPPACHATVTLSGPDAVDRGETATFSITTNRTIKSVRWAPADGNEGADDTSYEYTFDEPDGAISTIDAAVELNECTKYESVDVRVHDETRNRTGTTDYEPRLQAVSVSTFVTDDGTSPADPADGAVGTRFVAQLQYNGSERIKVEWDFEDGTEKTTYHSNIAGTETVSIERFYYYEDDRPDQPGTVNLSTSVSITAVDPDGDEGAIAWSGTVPHMPQRESTTNGSIASLDSTTPATVDQPVTVIIHVGQSTQIRWGDGAETVTSPTNRNPTTVSHTYRNPGRYTIEVVQTNTAGEQYWSTTFSVTGRSTETDYTVYRYQTRTEVTDVVEAHEQPEPGYERGRKVEPHYEPVEPPTTESFVNTEIPDEYSDSETWQRTDSWREWRFRQQSKLAHRDPDALDPFGTDEWTLVEEKAKCGDARNPRGPVILDRGASGACDRWLHRYNRTTRVVVHKVEFTKYEQNGWIWEWTNNSTKRSWTSGLTRPATTEYVAGTLTSEQYSCDDPDAPFHRQACGNTDS